MSTPSAETGYAPKNEPSPLAPAVSGDPSPGDTGGDSRPATEPDHRQRPVRWRWHWSLFAALALIGTMVLSRMMPWLSATIDTIGNFRWQIIFLCVCLAVYQLVARRPLWAGVILVLIALPALRMASLYWPAAGPPAGPEILRVLTLNLYDKNENVAAVSELIRDTNADVINLIEYAPHWSAELREALQEYPHNVVHPTGNAIYSRYPAEAFKANHPFFAPIQMFAATAKITVGDQRVLIVNVHPVSPISFDRWRQRNAEIALLAHPLKQLQRWHHIVLAGDFNATTECGSMRALLANSGLRDTRQGFGAQSSWPTWFWPIAICIDHAFVSPDVHVHRRETGPHVGSDHLPVIVELSFHDNQ